MVIDAMDLLYSGRFDGFCLVSSDSDFTRLAARLRESGLIVYGFGERKTPKPFVAACDKFIYIENLRSPTSDDGAGGGGGAGGDRRAPTAAQLKGDAALVSLLRKAVEAASDDDGWAQLGRGRQHHHQPAAGLRLAQLRLRASSATDRRDHAVRDGTAQRQQARRHLRPRQAPPHPGQAAKGQRDEPAHELILGRCQQQQRHPAAVMSRPRRQRGYPAAAQTQAERHQRHPAAVPLLASGASVFRPARRRLAFISTNG